MRITPSCGLVLGSLFAFGCGQIDLPPAAAPSNVLPATVEVPTEPPVEGKGRVLLEANGEKARVVEVAGGTVSARGYTIGIVAQRAVCASTPCVVDVERGPHRFVFLSPEDANHGGVAEVDIGTKPKVIRHAMGDVVEHPALRSLGNAGITVGAIGALTGGALLVGGLLSNAADESLGNSGNSKIVGASGAILGISAGVLAVGITLAILGRSEVRRGTTTEWTLPTDGKSEPPPKGATTHVRLTPTANGLGLVF